jgi:flagellar motor component MotA
MHDLSVFTREEREACLSVVDKFSDLCTFARREGIFGMEELVQQESDAFVAFALALIIEGREPELVRHMLQTLTNSDGVTGAALLKRILITEGILAIQAGENKRTVELILLCHLGMEFLIARGR